LTTTDAPGGRWAAAGPAGEDVAYRTQTLKFTGMELALDESIPLMTLFRLWLYAAVSAFAVFCVFGMLGLLVELSSLSSSSGSSGGFSDSGGGSGQGGLELFAAGYLLAFVVFWVVLLVVKIQEPVAEWKTLIEGKAAAAESSYAAIYHSLARRRIPVGVRPSRIRSDVLTPESVNNRLVITERTYVAYVSVFGFGTSLYVGWTMWRSRRGVVLVGQFLKDLIGAIIGRGGIVNQMLRTERVRAVREAVHSAVREGVDAAIEGINIPIAATFGYEIPIESASTPVAAPAFGMPGQPGQPTGQPGQPTGETVIRPAGHAAR
jgi:hypothetical protein